MKHWIWFLLSRSTLLTRIIKYSINTWMMLLLKIKSTRVLSRVCTEKILDGIKTPLITLVFSYLLSYPLVSFCISLQHRGIVFLTNTREYCLKRSDTGKINAPGHASFCFGKFAGVRGVGCWNLDLFIFFHFFFIFAMSNYLSWHWLANTI